MYFVMLKLRHLLYLIFQFMQLESLSLVIRFEKNNQNLCVRFSDLAFRLFQFLYDLVQQNSHDETSISIYWDMNLLNLKKKIDFISHVHIKSLFLSYYESFLHIARIKTPEYNPYKNDCRV